MPFFLAACSSGRPAKPDLPQSVSPGWKLTSYDRSARPGGLAEDGSPECWKADYEGEGSALFWLCWYEQKASAFDAVQRTPAEAQAVKFQEDHYLVLVKWNNAPRASLTALIRAIQKTLHPSG